MHSIMRFFRELVLMLLPGKSNSELGVRTFDPVRNVLDRNGHETVLLGWGYVDIDDGIWAFRNKMQDPSFTVVLIGDAGRKSAKWCLVISLLATFVQYKRTLKRKSQPDDPPYPGRS